MGKTGKWIKHLFTGKKEKELKKGTSTKNSSISTENPDLSLATSTKEKRRWSFRRSAGATKDVNPMESIATTCLQEVQSMMESQNGQIKHALAMAVATAAAADAAVKAAHASAATIHITTVDTKRPSADEHAAAIKIQSVFRSFLAKKALCALKGLVKLQALVRGHLVRKQANAALRCMQALVSVQARTRAQRILMAQETQPTGTQRQSSHRRPPHPHLQEHRVRQTYNDMEENIKIVEMDVERSSAHGSSYSSHKQIERTDHRFSTHYSGHHADSNQERFYQISPVPSALTDLSPRTCSGYFEEYAINLEQSSPQSSVSKPEHPFADYPFFPNYMANTESSKAKLRSHSAPKQRPDSYERQHSKQRLSMEGRNIPRAVRMQRSSSHVGSSAHDYRNPWSIKLDKSTVSLKDSECGSTSTILTNPNYCRSLAGYEIHGTRC